jgi:hypothetical protein
VSDRHPVSPRLAEMVTRRFGDGVIVAREEPMLGDASTRRYVRVRLEGRGAPSSLVAMVMQDREAAKLSDEVGEVGDSEEIPYVNVHHFLTRCGVDVPELYIDASDEGVLLLEDIGDTPLWDAVAAAPETEVHRLFGLAIEQLLRLQVDGMSRRDDSCVAFRRTFDRALYEWEFEHFIEWGFSGRIEGSLPAAELAELRRHFSAIAAFLGEQPRVLNHRDFHAWNLFVQGGDRIRVIDFQDALLAAAPYDLATLLGDRVTPRAVLPSLERTLVRDYGEAWSRRPQAPWVWDHEQLWQVYTACALQKAFKVVGRFHFLDRVKGKPGYLVFLPPTLERIRALLAERPDLAPVWAILQRYFPELRP